MDRVKGAACFACAPSSALSLWRDVESVNALQDSNLLVSCFSPTCQGVLHAAACKGVA